MPRAVFEVESGADAATRARRFARETIGDWTLMQIGLEAELVATELVTNAVLHGTPPVSLELNHEDGVLRVSVADACLLPPVLGRPVGDAMTGRGLGLVASLSRQWGVTPAHGERKGKVVWAEIALRVPFGTEHADGPADDDIDALLDQWDDDGFGNLERYAVVLSDVPTDLLLAAKAHVDNVVRELTLASSDSASGSALASPARLAAMLRDVVTNFAEARQPIKRQAIAAAQRGDERVALRLVLPLSMAAAGEAYLSALDELDEYARAARLLTVESLPEHRAFRRWYVQAIVDQLRAASAGGSPASTQTFERYLLAEISTLAHAQRISDLSARLQRATAALAGAARAADVARLAVTECIATLGASGGALLLPDQTGTLELAGEVGWADLSGMLLRVPAAAATPARTALSTGKSVWIKNRVDGERFPVLAEFDPAMPARCAVPLVVAGETVGVLVLVFSTPQLFANDDRAFVEALAAAGGQTLIRTRLYGEQTLLSPAEIGSFDWDLGTGTVTLDPQMCAIFGATPECFDSRFETLLETVHAEDREALEASLAHAVEQVGDFSAEYRIWRGGLLRWIDTRGRVLPDARGVAVRMLGVAFDSTEVRDARDRVARTLEQMTDGFFSLDAEWRFTAVNAAAERILERHRADLIGRSVWTEFPDTVGSEFEREYRRAVENGRPVAFEQYFTALGKHFQVRAYPAPDGLSVYFTDVSQAREFEAERAELRATSRHARDEAEVARTRLSFIAEVSADITTTLDLPEVCRRLAHHSVQRLANWVSVYVVDSGQCHRIAAAHRDPEWTRAMQRLVGKHPVDIDSHAMVGRAARTGLPVLEQHMTSHHVAAAYPDPVARALVKDMGMEAAFIAPMVAGSEVVGIMAFVRSQIDDEFGHDDIQLATTLANRGALAVQNALLYARQVTVAQALQQAVLPDALPVIPGVQLWARYEPAAGGAGVGGDFYDVFRLASGRIALAVGDAAGHGLQAGALMGQLRNALRAYAVEGRGPGQTLQALSDLLSALEPDAFATVFYAEFEPDTGELVWASAGHPPPLLTFADAPPRYLEADPAAPLGVYSKADVERRAVIPPGGGIFMYTDGLIERRYSGIDLGLHDLAAMIGVQRPGSRTVDVVVRGMSEEAGFADDVCVLLVVRSE